MNISPPEAIVGIVAAIIVIITWGVWYEKIIHVPALIRAPRALFAMLPLVLATGILVVLCTLAAHDVRDDPLWLAWYTVFGLAWVGSFRGVLVLYDLRWWDDALTRANPASARAVSGALLGLGASYAGANIGDGPGWWCVVIAAFPASCAVVLAWIAVALAGAAERISVERDAAAGLRTGALLLAVGIIGGRGAAGDWTSAAVTFREFAEAAWPILPLVFVALLVERRAPRNGVIFAVLWLITAIVVLALADPLPDYQPRLDGPE